MKKVFRVPKEETLRRLFDVVCATGGLMILSPLFLVLAVLILLCDGSPVFFRQTRVGQNGKTFRIWKFRTMRRGEPGCAITAAGDSRITRTGALLRKRKLDELPQLINVLKGDMSLVGPRPEVPQYVLAGTPMWEATLRVRPGITDLASLLYRAEEEILSRAFDTEHFYREHVLPSKLLLNLAYIRTRSFKQDLKLIWLTIRYTLVPERFNEELIHKTLNTGGAHDRYLHPISSAVNR